MKWKDLLRQRFAWDGSTAVIPLPPSVVMTVTKQSRGWWFFRVTVIVIGFAVLHLGRQYSVWFDGEAKVACDRDSSGGVRWRNANEQQDDTNERAQAMAKVADAVGV